MNKKFLAMAALGLITIGAQAKVKLPHILGDNMILQQNTEASLWGWDKPGTTVEVTTSWSGQKYSAKTGKDGKWAIKVQTPKASYTPLSITFDDGEKTTLNNVLAGEVWVCAGQSNMEMPMEGFKNQPVENAVEDIELLRDYLTYLRKTMGKAVEELELFDEAYAAIDWRKYENIPMFKFANRMNAYNTYLQLLNPKK